MRLRELHWATLDEGKPGPQRCVPADDFGHAEFQARDVKWSSEAIGPWNVVNGALRLKLIEEPKALLRERQGQRRVAGRDLHGNGGNVLPRSALGVDRSSELGHRSIFEEGAQGQIDPKGFAN